jgi:hypothetical protein
MEKVVAHDGVRTEMRKCYCRMRERDDSWFAGELMRNASIIGKRASLNSCNGKAEGPNEHGAPLVLKKDICESCVWRICGRR